MAMSSTDAIHLYTKLVFDTVSRSGKTTRTFVKVRRLPGMEAMR